jgi:CBS domain-containing protein
MMRRYGVHHLVVKKASNWVGIVSAHDLVRRSPAPCKRPLRVDDVITRHVVTIDEQASVDRAS